MDQSHLFASPNNSAELHQHSLQSQPPSLPAMAHTTSNQSPSQSSVDADSPSAAVTPGANPAETGLALGQQHPPHQPASSLTQSAYASAFSLAASAAATQQPSGHPGSSGMYQAPPQSHASSAAQYAPHDQSAALAPLQLGQLGVLGHQRQPTGFPYDFDPNDNSCRGVYGGDVDPTNPSQQVPQQLGTGGYIRHGGSIPVTPGQPHPGLAGAHGQHPLDMAAAANISLPVDINGEHGGSQGHQHAAHQQAAAAAAAAMHTPNTPSSFAASPAGGQSLFNTLSFQASHMQEYDPYNRPPKRTGRSTKPKRTPRPPNAFILYRKAKQAEVIRTHPGVSNKDVSCIIGQMWKAEDPSVQDKYREQAEIEKKKHKELHPNYKYQPRKPKNKRMQESQAAANAAASAALVSGTGQDSAFGSALPVGGSAGGMSSVLKDPSVSAGAGFSPYPKYPMMMQPGQSHHHQQQQQAIHSQNSLDQQHQQQQQQQLSRGDEYYYRGQASISDQQQPPQAHANGTFVGMPPQLDIKHNFMGGMAAAYWTPATPSDAAFSNQLPSGNVFHSSDQAAAQMRQFESVAPQHSAAAAAVAAGHSMGASAPMFHSFEHQRQAQQHGQAQQQVDGQGNHIDYQTGQAASYHQQHVVSTQQQQQQQQQLPPHSAAALGSYVGGGGQSYHHQHQQQQQQQQQQQGMEGLDGSQIPATDSQGLGLLSPPAVAWSTNM
ncbi:hypothetical protein GGF46_001861 [Coemansia sp. RSA 552]|nr:hypothetical protein GGF46_001861 [Coemansia sp. RSA 552]